MSLIIWWLSWTAPKTRWSLSCFSYLFLCWCWFDRLFRSFFSVFYWWLWCWYFGCNVFEIVFICWVFSHRCCYMSCICWWSFISLCWSTTGNDYRTWFSLLRFFIVFFNYFHFCFITIHNVCATSLSLIHTLRHGYFNKLIIWIE